MGLQHGSQETSCQVPPQSADESETYETASASKNADVVPEQQCCPDAVAAICPLQSLRPPPTGASDNEQNLMQKLNDWLQEATPACTAAGQPPPPQQRPEETPYEYCRTLRIWYNHLKRAGLMDVVNEINESLGAEKAVAAKANHAKRAASRARLQQLLIDHPARKSARNAGKPAPKYTEIMVLGEPVVRKGGRAVRHKALTISYANKFQQVPYLRVDPPTACKEECKVAAEAHAETLAEEPSYSAVAVKDLTQSMVSPGFWLQCPFALSVDMGQRTRNIWLVCANEVAASIDRAVAADAGGKVPGKAWNTVYLARDEGSKKPSAAKKGPYSNKAAGAGLSGGWRSFSIDHELQVGDAVVFARRKNPAAGREVLDVTIFRVWDHMTETQRAQCSTPQWKALLAEEEHKAVQAPTAAAQDPKASSSDTSSDSDSDGSEETAADKENCATNAGTDRKPVVKAAKRGQSVAVTATSKIRRKANVPKVAASAEDDLIPAHYPEDDAKGAHEQRRSARAASKASSAAGASRKRGMVQVVGVELKKQKTLKQRTARRVAAARKSLSDKEKAEERDESEEESEAEEHSTAWPAIDEEEEQFYVYKIRNSRVKGGRAEFLVHWWGYNKASDHTWEPVDNLDNPPTEYEWLKGASKVGLTHYLKQRQLPA